MLINYLVEDIYKKKGFVVGDKSLEYQYDTLSPIGGYFIFGLTNIPDIVLKKLPINFTHNDHYKHLISINTISVELPTFNILTVDILHGMGTITPVPQQIDYQHMFQVSFYENIYGDMMKLFVTWSRFIADEVTGLPLQAIVDDVKPEEYNIYANAWCLILPPYLYDNKDNIKSHSPIFIKFLNVFPKMINTSSYGANIQSNELITLSVSFACSTSYIRIPEYDNDYTLKSLYDALTNNTSIINSNSILSGYNKHNSYEYIDSTLLLTIANTFKEVFGVDVLW